MSNKEHEMDDQTAQFTERAGMLASSNTDIEGDYPEALGYKSSASFLNRSREMFARIWEKTADSTKAATMAFHQNAFQTISVGIGIVALIVYFMVLRFVCDRI